MDFFQAGVGGVVIGLAAALLLLFNGKIAGISGVVGTLISGTKRGDTSWRLLFLGGLLIGGAVTAMLAPETLAVGIERPAWAFAAAGLMVGFGTRLSSGCPSGHGVCGIGRLSKRSLIATVSFVATGFATVTLLNLLA